MERELLSATMAVAVMAVPGAAMAEFKIGAILSLTGPLALVGVPYQRTLTGIMPNRVGDQPATVQVLDDQGNPTEAVKAARKLITEGNVDVIISGSTTPSCAAVIDTMIEAKTPLICMPPTHVTAAQERWRFTIAADASVQGAYMISAMKAKGVKTVGVIGFADALTELVMKPMMQYAGPAGITQVADERFERTANSVTAQVLKIIGARPDAVFVAASGTPAALPTVTLRERGYTGLIFLGNTVAGPAFLRVGGAAVNGSYVIGTPYFVVDQLPDRNPMKPVGLEFRKEFIAKFGAEANNPYSAWIYDAYLLLNVAVPIAAKAGPPGTPAFRMALRDAMELTGEVVGTTAIYNRTPADHTGVDLRSQMLLHIENGQWKLVE